VEIRRLNRQITDLEARLLALIRTFRPQLLAELGCGPLVAAILIGHTAGVERFGSDASFALLSGTAAIPCSCGKRTQHRLNRAGDRQLNHALHIIAVTRANHDPASKAYLARKQAEGKTSKGALRCLKRTLARRFHRLLTDTPAPTQHERSSPLPPHSARPRGRINTAPATMHCVG
jgi:transposase